MSGIGKASTVAPQPGKVGPSTTSSAAAAGGGAKDRSDPGAARTGIPTRPATRPGGRSGAEAPVPEWKIRCLCADRGAALSAVVIGGLGCF